MAVGTMVKKKAAKKAAKKVAKKKAVKKAVKKAAKKKKAVVRQGAKAEREQVKRRKSSRRPLPEWVRISPAKAQVMIEHSLDFSEEFRNRRLTQTTVNFYRDEILAGRWAEYNGETIKLDADGVVLDGQHRLWAIIESGKTIDCLVLRGVDREDVGTVDIGKRRRAADFLGDAHVRTVTLSASIGWVYRYNERVMMGGGTHNRLSPTATRDLLDREPKIVESVWVANAVSAELGIPSPMAFAHYVMFRWAGREKADEFFNRLADGVGLTATNPIYLLRRKLLARKASRNKAIALDCLAWTFKAIRLFVEGKRATARSLQWRRAQGQAEDFPYLEKQARRRTRVEPPKKSEEKQSELSTLRRKVRDSQRK